MGKIKTTVWPKEPHTEAKHVILRKYLDAWLPILTTYQKRVLIIDGFAGPGEYEGGEDGSPIIAIKALLEHKSKIKSEVVFWFIESDNDRCDFLDEKLKKLDLPDNIKYECECSKFADAVKKLLEDLSEKDLKLAPTFAFIDPFGFKDIPFNLIKELMKNNKCEVLINFMFEEINRFVDLPQLEKTYNELFGTTEWRKVRGEKDPKKRLEILHNTYKSQLEKEADFVLSFKMVNKANKTDYFLFFATKHIAGLKKMKESMWKVDAAGSFEFSDARYDPNQTYLFEPEPNYNYLKKLILEKYKGKKISVEDLEYFIVVETPFRETHYKTKVLRPMEKNDEIQITYSGPKTRRRGTYPNGTIIEFL
jgi:three-Cys-motif partner protein